MAVVGGLFVSGVVNAQTVGQNIITPAIDIANVALLCGSKLLVR